MLTSTYQRQCACSRIYCPGSSGLLAPLPCSWGRAGSLYPCCRTTPSTACALSAWAVETSRCSRGATDTSEVKDMGADKGPTQTLQSMQSTPSRAPSYVKNRWRCGVHFHISESREASSMQGRLPENERRQVWNVPMKDKRETGAHKHPGGLHGTHRSHSRSALLQGHHKATHLVISEPSVLLQQFTLGPHSTAGAAKRRKGCQQLTPCVEDTLACHCGKQKELSISHLKQIVHKVCRRLRQNGSADEIAPLRHCIKHSHFWGRLTTWCSHKYDLKADPCTILVVALDSSI
eukprot:scaffold37634_cov19-Tisochrysis_lutea.AAC.1